MKPEEKSVEEVLKQYWSSAPQEEAEADCNRVLHRLRTTAESERNTRREASGFLSFFGTRMGMMSAAAAVLLAVFIGPIVWRQYDAPGVLESADGSGKLEYGELLRVNSGAGGTLVLADGSLVEMRSATELSLERADDGVRIHLSKGDVIVSAAKQHGHLYVQTKDVMVSVVGTVFLVKAEQEGSRVAVIEGEVRVQQGTTEQNLRPGQQVSTNPLMAAQPVKEELSWSRNAEEHLALLQQSAAPAASRGTAEPRLAFEEASIRPSGPMPEGQRGGPYAGCTGGPNQFDARRFLATHKTLYSLITMAYGLPGRGCGIYSQNDLLSGGPGWIKTDEFDIEALIPEGSPGYTLRQFQTGEARGLQLMLQTLLENRFKLVLRHEMKEMPVFTLRLGKDGTRAATSRAVDNWIGRDTGAPLVFAPGFKGTATESLKPGVLIVAGRNATMGDLAVSLQNLTGTGRPVLDRTGLTGEYNFDLSEFASFTYNYRGGTSPQSIFTAIEEQLGLKLESAKAPVEILVIDHVEKPSEN